MRDFATGVKWFQNPSPGWPGLTNGKARTRHRRAIRFAPDPATHTNRGVETTSWQFNSSDVSVHRVGVRHHFRREAVSDTEDVMAENGA